MRLLCSKQQLSDLFSPLGLPERPNSPIEHKKEGEASSMYSSLPTSDAPGNGRQMQVYLHFSESFLFF